MLKSLKGFQDFILRGNAVELAVGVVIGAAFNTMIQSIVKDFLTPLISATVGAPDFSGWSFVSNNSKFMIGDLMNSMISFLLVATAIYFFVITPMNRLIEIRNKINPEFGKKTKKCPECLSDIPYAAKRCSHCCSKLPVK